MTKFIKLTGYKSPAAGETFRTEPLWVNPKLVAHMRQYQARRERAANGAYYKTFVYVTSIAFAAAFAEEVVGVSVLETPEEIMEMAQ
ncbi:MAG: hypothetical protein WC455_15010 [Dehalococcoidia bacterium]